MRIKPIRSEADHREALLAIERCWNARPGTAEHDQLEVLATLVDVYEQSHAPIEPADAIEALRFRMEQQGLTRRDLLPYFRTRARVSEVLSRKRRLTLAAIRALHRGLGIPLDVLVAEPSPPARASHRAKSRPDRAARTTKTAAGASR